ncbi:MAG: hypothetical protein R3194_10565, partial [Limnobacter sp.]|nr:hypothetical protein [Limnobacter sp.]
MLDGLDPMVFLAAVLIGIGLVALAFSLLIQGNKKEKALRRIDGLVAQRRQTQKLSMGSSEVETESLAGKLDKIGEKLSKTRAFNMFVEEEDRKMLGRAGLGSDEDLNRYVVLRLGLSMVAVVIWFFISQDYRDFTTKAIQFVGLFGLGFMAPKWVLRAYSKNVEAAFEKELVALVDVMRLLQGVGLSVEQSLEVVATQLRDLVPITGRILYRAKTQVKSGVTWNQILHKMTRTYNSPEFKSFVAVISQIEKYGGAVQEP